MASNLMNNKWLRPVLALCVLAGLLALGGCGGGSGAPNNPFAVVGPLSVLPPDAVVFSHTPTTLQVTGGSPPYQAFSSNSGVLPVAQNVDGSGVIVLLPGEVAADTGVVITIRDALARSVTASLTVSPAPLFNTLTVVPSRTVCGVNAVCSGDTATATVRVTGVAGGGIPNRQVRFDVVLGAFALQSNNPALPLVSSLTVVSDANGDARVVLQAAVNAPTQPAQIRATDLTTNNSVVASFIIVQQTDGSAILSVIPATATITGVFTTDCSFGARVDYFIYGGTPPYNVFSTFPDAVFIFGSPVLVSGGAFEAVTNGACVDPLTFTIVDATGRQTTALLRNLPGTMVVPPPPPPAALVITPATSAAAACLGKTFQFLVTGGTPSYSAGAVTNPAQVTPPMATVLADGKTVEVTGILNGASVTSVIVTDQSSPQKSVTATITCS